MANLGSGKLVINIVIGSEGLIGSPVCEMLSKHGDQNFFLDKYKNEHCSNFYAVNLENTKEIENFITKLPRNKHASSSLNIIYLASIDAKIGQPWPDFLEFDLNVWREYSKVNQEAMLFFVSRILKYYLNQMPSKYLHFIFFPSLYNYLGPDQRSYSGWPKTSKPFEYIGTKSMTRDLSNYINSTYAHKNVRANCIIPHLVTSGPHKPGEMLLKKMLTGRGTEAVEVAETVDFLLNSPKNLIGQDIFIDGGWSKV